MAGVFHEESCNYNKETLKVVGTVIANAHSKDVVRLSPSVIVLQSSSFVFI